MKAAFPKRNAAVLIILAITVAVWAITLMNGFVYDDNKILLGNPWVRDFGRIPDVFRSSMMAFDPAAQPANTYRPLLTVVFMAEYALFGFTPFWFHLANIIIHALNAVLVFMIAGKLLDSDGGDGWAAVLPPLFAGLLFSLHAINSEAVNWVSASAELLYSFFCLAGFYLYMKGTGPAKGFVAAIFLFAALLFKEPGAALLGLVVLFDLSTSGKKAISNWRGYAFMAAAAGIYAVLRLNAVGGLMHHKQIGFSAADVFLNIFPLFAEYISKLFWPAGLNALYMFRAAHSAFEPKVLLGAALAAILLAAMVLTLARRQKALFMGICFMLLPLLPVLYVPALSTAAFADRYLYLPSAGFAIIGAVFFKRMALNGGGGKKLIITIVALTALVGFAAASVKRSMVWRSDLSLWADTVAKSPLSSNAHYNYAWAAHREGNTSVAIEQYDEAARLDPKGSADAHYNLGLIFLDGFMLDEAEREFRAAIYVNPGYREAVEMLSRVELLRAGAGK